MDLTWRRRDLLLAAAAAATVGACDPRAGFALPAVDLPPLAGLTSSSGWPVPGISSGDFTGRVSLLNVWASWCPYCQAEHGELLRLSQDGRFRMVGLVYRDAPAKAVAYLRRPGNPFAAVSLDNGTLTAALNQRGVPASYVIDRSARLVLKIPGELGEGTVRDKVMPAILKTLDGVSNRTG